MAVLCLRGQSQQAGLVLVLFFVASALWAYGYPKARGFSFTLWVLACVSLGLYYPQAVQQWGQFKLERLIVPLVQLIMFAMGTTLCPRDFLRVLSMPWPVLIGMLLQFVVMPITGLALATAFGFQGEIAAGIVLIGSCSGGVASNLMAYLAGGNVALSVTMTACSTMLAPLLTPLLMQELAGQFVPISFLSMALGVIKIVIVPIIAGLAANAILYSRHRWARNAAVLAIATLLTGLAAVALACLPEEALVYVSGGSVGSDVFLLLDTLCGCGIIGFALLAGVAVVKLAVNVIFRGPENWANRALPLVSMTAICIILAIITAQTRDELLTVGIALLVVAVIHNTIGYLLGYWLAKAARLNETDCRTVAFEVGMQNGGMATGIAINVLHSHAAALPPNVFGTWMNISGSLLAKWWHQHPPSDALDTSYHDK
ncbi:MAG: bile acid:sodium symporter family protein [Planctomycetota bacterium]|nr:bile acid:sodium symporter family protein [Planctomycetota bacterium]